MRPLSLLSPGELLDGGLGGGVGLNAGQTGGGGGEVGPEEHLLGPDDLLGPGHGGDLEEAGGGVAVRVVGARRGGEARGQLRGGRGQGEAGEGEEGGHHLVYDEHEYLQLTVVLLYTSDPAYT